MFFSTKSVILALMAATALLAPASVHVSAQAATDTATSTTDTTTLTGGTPTYSTASDQETLGTTETTASTTTSASNETTATTDDDEPASSTLDCGTEYSGDGQCDDFNNIAACDYDGGDCCSCTCVPNDFNCGGNYDCIDPDATCVEDDDGNGGTLTSETLVTDAPADVEADSSANGWAPVSPISGGMAAAAAAIAAVVFAF